MTLDIQFRVRVKDLLDYIDQAFGGLEQLEAHLRKNPDDAPRILLFEAAEGNVGTPNRVVTFGKRYLGDTSAVVSAPKVELLEHLMRHPGLSLRELARALDRDPSTISEHLEDLERSGLVLKESHGAGRPVTLRTIPQEIHIRLTREGEDATAEA